MRYSIPKEVLRINLHPLKYPPKIFPLLSMETATTLLSDSLETDCVPLGEPVLDDVVHRYIAVRGIVAMEANRIGIPLCQQLSNDTIDSIARSLTDTLASKGTVAIREVWASARERVTQAMRRE